MKILVYVEGPSDKLSLETVLKPLLEQKRQQGISITFHEAPAGDKKVSVLNKVPVKAVNILCNEPDSIVVAIPDLYPKNHGLPHSSADELCDGMKQIFAQAVERRGCDTRVGERFFAFCFIHDLEALLLAVPDLLRQRIGAKNLKQSWIVPVEEQNNQQPPKYVVQRLFDEAGKKYKDTVDSPMILANANYLELAEACPQGFGKFVRFLEEQNV